MMTVLQTAESLGLELPTYSETDRPDLFQCWKDRVDLFAQLHAAGRDTIALRRETNLYAGHNPPSSPFDPFGLEIPAWLDAIPEAAFVDDANGQALLAEIGRRLDGQHE